MGTLLKPDDGGTSAQGDEVADVLIPEQRRLVMSRIKGEDTNPNMILRRGLYRRGLRCRLHKADTRSKPDMVFPRYAVVFMPGVSVTTMNAHYSGGPIPELRLEGQSQSQLGMGPKYPNRAES